MHEVLSRNLFFVKEHVGMFKAANNYDVLCPETGEELLHCREPNLGFFTKMLRFTDYKRNTPFNVVITTPSGEPVLRVSRGISIFLSKVDVFDDNDRRIGGFKQKLFSIGGAFSVLGADDLSQWIRNVKAGASCWPLDEAAMTHWQSHVDFATTRATLLLWLT